MVTYYLDTSAATKLYVLETGSAWLRQLLLPASRTVTVLSTHLLRVEIWSAFARRLRDNTLTATQYNRVSYWFAQHQHTLYRLRVVDEIVIQQTRGLFDAYRLRAYDAVHLATAIIANQPLLANALPGLTFLCADERLLAAATAEGLAVDNPNDHP